MHWATRDAQANACFSALLLLHESVDISLRRVYTQTYNESSARPCRKFTECVSAVLQCCNTSPKIASVFPLIPLHTQFHTHLLRNGVSHKKIRNNAHNFHPNTLIICMFFGAFHGAFRRYSCKPFFEKTTIIKVLGPSRMRNRKISLKSI